MCSAIDHLAIDFEDRDGRPEMGHRNENRHDGRVAGVDNHPIVPGMDSQFVGPRPTVATAATTFEQPPRPYPLHGRSGLGSFLSSDRRLQELPDLAKLLVAAFQQRLSREC